MIPGMLLLLACEAEFACDSGMGLLDGECVPLPGGGDSDTPTDADEWQPAADCPQATLPDPGTSLTPSTVPPGGGLRALAQGSGDGDPLYAGTETNGVYRLDSLDGEWIPLYSPWGHIRSEIAVHPDDAGIILYGGGTDVYRSENGGQSGAKVDDVSATAPDEVWGLAFDPADGDRAWAIRTDGKVYRSADAGVSWEQIAKIDVDPQEKLDSIHRQWRIAPNPSGDGRVAFCCSYDQLMLSEDAGESWESVLDDTVHARAVLWDRADPDRLIAGRDDGLWVMEGEDWSQVLEGPEIWVADMTDDGASWYAGEQGGTLHASADGGGSWTTSEVTGSSVAWAALVTHGEGTLVWGHEEGVERYDGDWSPLVDGFIDWGMSVFAVDPNCPSVVWAGSLCSRGIFRSEDYGVSWTHDAEYFHYVMRMEFSPVARDEVWVSSDDWIARSRDAGISWEDVGTGLGGLHFHALALHPEDAEVALAGTTGSGIDADDTARVLLTTDGGDSWEEGAGLPESEATVYSLAWVDAGTALLGTYAGGLFHDEGAGFGLWRSGDGGRNWEQCSPTVLDVPDLWVGHGLAWAATDGGLYVSADGGVTWEVSAVADSSHEPMLAVAFSPRDAEVGMVLTAALDLYRTDDGGASWSAVALDGATLGDGEGTPEADLVFTADGRLVFVAAPLTGTWWMSVN